MTDCPKCGVCCECPRPWERKIISYNTPHAKGDPGTEDHIDCDFCNTTDIGIILDEVLLEESGFLLGYLVGKVMKKMKGKANPGLVAETIKGRLLKST